MRENFGGGRPTHSSLAAAHADARERLQAIDLGNALFPRGLPYLARRDFLASTDHGLVRNARRPIRRDRKSTRLNSSHLGISYAVFCLKKKNINEHNAT